jgi:hypothetical protein
MFVASLMFLAISLKYYYYYYYKRVENQSGLTKTGEKRLVKETLVLRKTGIDPSWELDFTWLEATKDKNGEPEMWCTYLLP